MWSDRVPGDPRCPACGITVDGFTSIALDDARPDPGDPTVCVHCASVLIFGDDLHPRFPTDDELALVIEYPEVKVARAAVLEVIRQHGVR